MNTNPDDVVAMVIAKYCVMSTRNQSSILDILCIFISDLLKVRHLDGVFLRALVIPDISTYDIVL